MRAAYTTLALSLLVPTLTGAQNLPSPERTQPMNRVLTHREQAPIVRSRIVKRFETVLPELMRREGIDMWIMVTREYNNDPVFQSMAPLTTYSSRRRTILVLGGIPLNPPTPRYSGYRGSAGRFPRPVPR